uniref:Uncharacterized protein n=1 Tax=Triticum urartu TaxID=4572 RepID=A0A8R7QSQ6_TRIUA
SLRVGHHIRVADTLPGSGEDHEHHASEEASGKRQVDQQLPRVRPGVREEAALYAGVGERDGEEHERGDDGVHQVHGRDPEPGEVLEHRVPLAARAGEVERVEAPERGRAVVEPAVAADEAVREGEEHAGGGAAADERQDQAPVGRVADAVVVAEGRRQRLEGQHRTRRQELQEVRRARQRLVRRRKDARRWRGLARRGLLGRRRHLDVHSIG